VVFADDFGEFKPKGLQKLSLAVGILPDILHSYHGLGFGKREQNRDSIGTTIKFCHA